MLMDNPVDIRFNRLLSEEYPAKEVVSLNKKNPALYRQISNHCQGLSISSKDYIQQLGFKVLRSNQSKKENIQQKSLSEDECKNKLKSYYPSGIIDSINQIHIKDNFLYINLKEVASVYDMNVSNLLLSWNYRISSASTFDFLTLQKLRDFYNFQSTECARWFGVTRQRISQLLKKKGTAHPFWISSVLNEKDIVKINELIAKKTTFLSENQCFIKIYRGKDFTAQNVAILIKDEESTRCLFDIPSSLHDNLVSLNYHLLDEVDFEFIRSTQMEDINESKPFMEEEVKTLNKRLKKFNQNHKTTYNLKQLIDFYQIKNHYINVSDRRYVSEQEIKEILTKHYNVDTGLVKVPIDNPSYQRLVRLAQNRGLNLKGLIEAHGFFYERDRKSVV